MEQQFREAGCAPYVIYTKDLGETMPIAKAMLHIDPYFNGSYFSGTKPVDMTIPHAAVIDMKNMKPIIKLDAFGPGWDSIDFGQLLTACNQASQD